MPVSRSKLVLALFLNALVLGGAAWAEDAPGGEGDLHSAFPPFDPATFAPSLFWLLISFGALYWLMSRLALPRVSTIIEDRNATIANDLDRAEIMQKKAEVAGDAYVSALAKAKANAVMIGQQAKDAASGAASLRRKAVEAEVAEKIAAAEARITALKTSAMTNVSGIAGEAAIAIVARLTGVAPSVAEAEKAVASTISA